MNISISGKNMADALLRNGQSSSEWARPPKNGQHLEGLSRSHIYKLIVGGKIQSITLNNPGSKRGVRLISIPSLRNFIASEAAKQLQEAV